MKFLSFQECARNHRILDTTNARIVGGTTVVPNSLPWQAFIRIARQFRCGGSILNKRFVISAMHCFIDNVDIENPGSDIIVGKVTIITNQDSVEPSRPWGVVWGPRELVPV